MLDLCQQQSIGAAHISTVDVSHTSNRAGVPDPLEFLDRTHALEMGTSWTELRTGRLTANNILTA